ncbi:hypothetical protein HPP92_003201 [Vanilla planifolia]|uniref:Uncharacterized protein n=1 Tax=Vanilla planifolia TaxID=51239 RepID=A0A835S1B4_VANPL|nr:hypothetical protein HPP92_003201 [Vanilla planifolia]
MRERGKGFWDRESGMLWEKVEERSKKVLKRRVGDNKFGDLEKVGFRKEKVKILELLHRICTEDMKDRQMHEQACEKYMAVFRCTRKMPAKWLTTRWADESCITLSKCSGAKSLEK